VSGNDVENTATTGDVKVIIKQDGIGRTGGIVLGVVAGLALGIAVITLVDSIRNTDRTEEASKLAEREARMLQYYLLELDAKVIKAGIKPADEAIANKLKETSK
jgi:hypothetical protein